MIGRTVPGSTWCDALGARHFGVGSDRPDWIWWRPVWGLGRRLAQESRVILARRWEAAVGERELPAGGGGQRPRQRAPAVVCGQGWRANMAPESMAAVSAWWQPNNNALCRTGSQGRSQDFCWGEGM